MKLFPEKRIPKIYAYQDKHYPDRIKVGYTTRTVRERLADQVKLSEEIYTVIFEENAIRDDNSFFTDHDVHKTLKQLDIERLDGEWFKCGLKELQQAFNQVKTGKTTQKNRILSFKMRPEQEEAVKRTAAYFRSLTQSSNKEPHFLWNAKMRFGKTFAAYQLARTMGWKRILVMTFKPAVLSAWRDDLLSHTDFEGWQFISNQANDLSYNKADFSKPIVCFGSFQDFLGKDKKSGGIKSKNEWVHTQNWDCVIFDEYHFGAWREKSKELFEGETDREIKQAQTDDLSYFDEKLLPITTNYYLYLSGTPFRALANGEFIEEQIYNWTYSDEQKAKLHWQGEKNPYRSLPRVVMMTYQMPSDIRNIAKGGEFNEFDLNEFFAAKGEGNQAEFKHKDDVQKWLNLIRGQHLSTNLTNLKLNANRKPPMPYSDSRLLGELQHTFWFLPNVAACNAMANLLAERQNIFYQEYEIIVAAGNSAGIGLAALDKVQKKMTKQPLNTKSITLSCGKLTTGVSVPAWAGIFILRNLSSPETYFQAAFRVQTPWVLRNRDGYSPNQEEILKEECYIFDFSPNRALSQVSEYSCRLSLDESSPEKKVQEFIQFLPILAYDGSTMKEIDAAGVLDMAMSGTTATLLAKRWQSALLVNVDNVTLDNVLANEKAKQAIENIEGFRQLSLDFETIINKSNEVKDKKREASEKDDLNPDEKKELSDKEKEVKSLRKQVQEKLIKLATRIPIFMYLTDYREQSLKDIITQLEPDLFKRVTGLTVEDFEILVELNLFNGAVMNNAIFNFKRYEDNSLEYSGINPHKDEKFVGGFNTVLTQEDYLNLDLN